MARSKSGRIVVEVDPNIKRNLYANLAGDETTLKAWFTRVAEEYCSNGGYLFEKKILVDEPFLPSDLKCVDKSYQTVSMFSGCGGMDLGFRGGFNIFRRYYPKLPFDIVWANDLNDAACRTYRKNLGNEIRCGDIWELLDSMPSRADVLIGGFPCQDISINGKGAGVAGKRSGLYRAMVEAVKRLRPSIFIAENVKGLLLKSREESLKRVIDDFKALNYNLSLQLYKAVDYGVPQMRERVFIVGTPAGYHPFTPPHPERNPDTWMTSEEAIGDFIDLPEDANFNHVWSRAAKSPEQGSRIISAHKPAHTIRAECHGNIQFHYSLPRRLSMREAARIQTFPDDFIFDSKLRETERQIGNAVPPVLAWHIAKASLRALRSGKINFAESATA